MLWSIILHSEKISSFFSKSPFSLELKQPFWYNLLGYAHCLSHCWGFLFSNCWKTLDDNTFQNALLNFHQPTKWLIFFQIWLKVLHFSTDCVFSLFTCLIISRVDLISIYSFRKIIVFLRAIFTSYMDWNIWWINQVKSKRLTREIMRWEKGKK